jgi:O-acetyl-ADP-ribose deacetylase (regulator of RNase III)
MSASPEIEYKVGDATTPEVPGPKVIAHVCNDIGGWGRGFVVAISNRWPEPEREYRAWHASSSANPPIKLGEVQFVNVADDIWVANMIAQRDIRTVAGVPPIRYDAIRSSLSKVGEFTRVNRASVNMPRIGCGLAGGTWAEVSGIISAELLAKELRVYVYDLPQKE